MRRPKPFHLILILSFGLVSISFGAIFVKLSHEAPSMVIAFFRMFWASLFLLPFYLGKSRISGQRPRWFVMAGFSLGLHFAFWVSSLRYTSVVVSISLVNTAPIFVVLLSHFLLRERLRIPGLIGISVALLGASLLVWNDISSLVDWKGAILSLGGAVMLALYLVVGRHMRQQVQLIHYACPTYFLATAILGLMALLSNARFTGFSKETYGFLFLLGLIPQSLGHTSCNWALRYLPATLVSMLVLAESVLATVFAYWILDETVGSRVALGGSGVALEIFLVSGWGIKAIGQRVEVAVAILWKAGQVWIQKRKETEYLEGFWEFPGGKLEFHENPQHAVCREIWEETGLRLPPDLPKLILVEDYPYPEREVRLHFFLCRLDIRPVLPNGRWIGVGQLDTLLLPAANRRIIQKLKFVPSD